MLAKPEVPTYRKVMELVRPIMRHIDLPIEGLDENGLVVKSLAEGDAERYGITRSGRYVALFKGKARIVTEAEFARVVTLQEFTDSIERVMTTRVGNALDRAVALRNKHQALLALKRRTCNDALQQG